MCEVLVFFNVFECPAVFSCYINNVNYFRAISLIFPPCSTSVCFSSYKSTSWRHDAKCLCTQIGPASSCLLCFFCLLAYLLHLCSKFIIFDSLTSFSLLTWSIEFACFLQWIYNQFSCFLLSAFSICTLCIGMLFVSILFHLPLFLRSCTYVCQYYFKTNSQKQLVPCMLQCYICLF